MSENMWGNEFSSGDRELMPNTLLREQADLLYTATGGRLIGELETIIDGSYIVSYLNIRNSTRTIETGIVKIRYPIIEIYPIALNNLVSQESFSIDNPEDFKTTLRQNLGGAHIQKYMSRMWDIAPDM